MGDEAIRELIRNILLRLTPKQVQDLLLELRNYERRTRRGSDGHLDPAISAELGPRLLRNEMRADAFRIRAILGQDAEELISALRRAEGEIVFVPNIGTTAEDLSKMAIICEAGKAIVHAERNGIFLRPWQLLEVIRQTVDKKHTLVVAKITPGTTLVWIEDAEGRIIGPVEPYAVGNESSLQRASRRVGRAVTALSDPQIIGKILKGMQFAGMALFVTDAITAIRDLKDPQTHLRMLDLYAQMIVQPDIFTVMAWMHEMQKMSGPFNSMVGYIFYAQIVNSEGLADFLRQIDPKRRREVYDRIRNAIAAARREIRDGTFTADNEEEPDHAIEPFEPNLDLPSRPTAPAAPSTEQPPPAKPKPVPEKPRIPFPNLTRENIRDVIERELRGIEENIDKAAEEEGRLRKAQADRNRYPEGPHTRELIEEYERRRRIYEEWIDRALERIYEYEKALREPGRPEGEVTPDLPSEPRTPAKHADETAGDETRERIRNIRKRIRDLERWLRETDESYTEVRKQLQEYIDGERRNLDRERDYAEDLGQDTGEGEDEPLVPPQPPSAPLITVTYIRPMESYYNRRTGQEQMFPADHPPKSSDWERVVIDPATGKSNVRWGWVPIDDPVTGKRRWVPGWTPANRYKQFPGTAKLREGDDPRKSLELGLLRNWSELMAAQRAGIDISRIGRMMNLFLSQSLVDQFESMQEDRFLMLCDHMAEAASLAVAARREARGKLVSILPSFPLG